MTARPGRAARARPSGSGSCCSACRTPIPTCARCSTSRGSRSGAPGARRGYAPLEAAVDAARLLRRAVAVSPPPTIDLEDLGLRPRRPPAARAGPAPPCRSAGASPSAAATPRSACTCAPGAARSGHALRGSSDADGPAGVASGRRRHRPLARRRAGRRARRRPRSSRGPGRRWGLAARGALVEAGGPALHFDLDEKRPGLGRAVRRGSTPRPPRASGTRPRRSTGTRPSTSRRSRGGRRPGDDLPGRERAGRAGRARPLPRPDPPPLPRGGAAPGGPGRRRGPPRRGLHPPRRAAAGGPLGVSGAGGRASLAPCSRSPTSRSPRSCSRCSARARSCNLLALPRAPRARPGHPPGRAPGPPGRGAPRRVRHGPPRAPGGARARPARPAARRRSSAATTRWWTPPG